VPNAGIAGHAELQLTAENLELIFVTNHLGHFKMYKDLEPLILKAAEESGIAVVAVVSSSASYDFHEVILDEEKLKDPDVWGFFYYAHSKLFNSTFLNLEGEG
jgi:NAD(P)-dependent dehydrogenase (short-subunit alcohol dehydrogenase family)